MARRPPRAVGLALQGGGSHGAFTWGVLDRLMELVEASGLRIAGFSGASAGGINAALCAAGLAIGGPAEARAGLRAFWEALSRRGAALGNPLFGFADPGIGGFNIDWSPGAILLEAAGLVVSPYTNPLYVDALAPLLRDAFPPATLAALNAAEAPRIFVSATNVGTNALALFTQPDVTIDTLRATACLPSEFRAVQIGDGYFWDGGYLGNPALDPLLDLADDLLLVLINPLAYDRPPPTSARQILDRLNQVTFNAALVRELNAIEAVNKVLRAQGKPPGGKSTAGRYRPIRIHAIESERFMQALGVVSKSSTSWPLIEALFEKGREAADHWTSEHHDKLGREFLVRGQVGSDRPGVEGQAGLKSRSLTIPDAYFAPRRAAPVRTSDPLEGSRSRTSVARPAPKRIHEATEGGRARSASGLGQRQAIRILQPLQGHQRMHLRDRPVR